MSKYFKYHPSYQEETLIFKTVEAAVGFYGLREANLYFNGLCNSEPEFVQQTNNVYRYKDYYIQAGKRFLMAGHGECLMGLNRLELSCLPQGIALIWLDNNEDMVLITRITGSEGHRLVPYSEYGTGISEQTRKNLLADVDRLMDANYALMAVTGDKDTWYIIEGKEQVVFSYCNTAFVPDNAKPAYRRRVLEALGLQE